MASYEFSYAPTNRAMCKGKCKEKIAKGAVRLGVSTEAGGHTMTQYRCLPCVTDKQIENICNAVGSLDQVNGFDGLGDEDQAAVLAKAEGGDQPAGKAKAKGKAAAKATAAAAKAEGKAKAKAKAKAAGRMPPEAVQHSFLDKAKAIDFDAVREVLDATPQLVNCQPAGRWSALAQFAAAGNAAAVEYLLGLGADRDAQAKDGTTPRAVAKGPCVALLAAEENEEADDGEEEPEPAAASSSTKPPAAAKAAAKRKPTLGVSNSDEAPAAKKAKIGRPVDAGVPNRGDYSVVDDWSVLLNQTNVVANNNKYYKIQVLQSAGKFYCWTHWGRVGLAGQNSLEQCASQAAAEEKFRGKFRQKSGVDYSCLATHDWTPKVGKYTYVETEEQEGGEGGDNAPLGKLTPQQIEKGQGVLEKIQVALNKKDKGSLQDLSSQFYTLIPHDFGMKLPPAITTKEMLETEEELLKFYLRMGFEEMDKVDDGLSPVSGIMDLPLPPNLEVACSKLCAASAIKASTEKGRQHAGKQSGNPSKKMEAHLYGAIMLYTSNAIYRDLNAVLRSEDRTRIKKYFQYLRLLLEALGTLPQQKKTLWRGVNVDLYDQYAAGSTVTWWGVSSCTADINVAKNFMNGCGGKCTLLIVETKTAADISAITFFGNEKENLLAPGTQLKVLSSKREGRITEIRMQEVGRVLA